MSIKSTEIKVSLFDVYNSTYIHYCNLQHLTSSSVCKKKCNQSQDNTSSRNYLR